jgi:uncharacterized membrane protein YeaQ/YmgE (transglycosylase-associated protein family)
MGILSWIILGAIAGWLASKVMKTDAQQGIIANILVGVLGAGVGGFVFSIFGGVSVTGLNLYSIMVALVGSVILLYIYKIVVDSKK